MPQRPIQARDAVAARAKRPEPALQSRLLLRAATDADVPALVSIINGAYAPIDWWLFERPRTEEDALRREMAKDGASSIVCELDGSIVGHILLWLNETDPYQGAWIGMLATALNHQRHGIATVLVEEAEARASAAGFSETLLDCVRENGLVEYYESMGYIVLREERGRMREATFEWTRVYMRKTLP